MVVFHSLQPQYQTDSTVHFAGLSSLADKGKGKGKRIYIAPLLKYLTLKALRYGSHNVTCKLHRTCL